jgi:hypothetical protein
VVAKFRERLAVIKKNHEEFHIEGFNPKKKNEVECKEQYQLINSNKFAVLEN